MKKALEQDRREKTDDRWRTTDDRPELDPPCSAGSPSHSAMTERGTLCQDESDDAIIERILNGEINAFEILARRYEHWVCGIVSKRVGHEHVPEIAQEVFIHAYQSLPHYSPRQSLTTDGQSLGHAKSSFKQWLATTAVRRCYDFQRATYRHPTCAISNLNTDDREQMERICQTTSCETFFSDINQDMMREALLQAMEGLETDDQTLLGLVYGMGYSLPETADMLGNSLATVKSRAYRARVLLRQQLDSVEPARQLFSLESSLIPRDN